MDIKLKKSKPFRVWICFFIAVSLMTGFLFAALALLDSDGVGKGLKDPFGDYRSSVAFKERTANYYSQLFSLAVDTVDSNNLEMTKSILDDEGRNIKYYAFNKDKGLLLKNIKGDLSTLAQSSEMPVLPTGYNYFWYFDGQKLWVVDHGKNIDIKRIDSGYRGISFPTENGYASGDANLANTRILLAVKDNLVQSPYGQSSFYSSYYKEQQLLLVLRWIDILLLALAVLLLVYVMTKRSERREFERKLASWSGWMWLEFKTLLALLALTLSVGFSSNCFGAFDRVLSFHLAICPLVLGLWWFYIMFNDLRINGKSFFTHNSINSLLTWYRKYEKRYDWQKSMLIRAYALVAVEAVLALISVMFLIGTIADSNGLALLVALMIAGAGVNIIYRYLRRYDATLCDLGRLMDHIELIKKGDMQTRLEVAADADISPAAQNLNSIQEGMNVAVAEKVKSEHMKIELITNVSHDLKTPLTSIISYVDLLNKEEDLPEHVNDYIKILAQKSERLKNLIQDLFDLSKASSDNIALDLERIDLARLIKQTLADMEEPINASGLTFKLNIPDEPIYILSDGKKLYRVWENLISNALKYSLTGSRVFVDLTVDGADALAAIKNTANYEMNFSPDEIMQRFVRGDESRSSEGSGLGLSIAQSFTQICGGKFSIKIDGDLFKVEMQFKNQVP